MSALPPIFANHAHVFPESVNPNGTISRLLKMLDTCGIENAICFAPFPSQMRGFDLTPNQWLANQLKTQPRLRGFGTIDVGTPNAADQVKAAVDLGFRGLKMHPQGQEFDLLGKPAFEVYEAAQKHNLFITFHSGIHHGRIKWYNVLNFDEIAHHFPELRFSLEHVGGYAFFREAMAVIVNRIPFPPVPGKRCLVFAGLTSIFTQNYNRFWYMPPENLKELIIQAGIQQMIFGLDFPYNLEEGTLTALKTLRSLGLSEADLALVLGGNLRRELGY